MPPLGAALLCYLAGVAALALVTLFGTFAAARVASRRAS
jgi:hypothetical protein